MATHQVRGERIQAAGEHGLATIETRLGDWEKQWKSNKARRDGEDKYHITLWDKSEPGVAAIGAASKEAALAAFDADAHPWIDVGCGSTADGAARTAYRVVCWPAAAALRETLGLPWKDLHITLGFQDREVHGKPKGLATLKDSTPGSTAAAVGDTLAAIQALVKADPASPILVPLLELAIAAADALGDAPTQLLGRRLLCKVSLVAADYGTVVEGAGCALELLAAAEPAGNPGPRDREPLAIWHTFRGLALVKLQEHEAALGDLSAALDIMRLNAAFTEQQVVTLHRAAVQCRSALATPSPGTFFKFPRTAHLFDAGGSAVTRDDLLVGDPEFWIGAGNTLLVEEKVDGGNLGITCDTNHTLMYQNRSHHVNEASHPQWVGLERWADEFGTALAKILEPERRVLFGEWCTTVHSLEYTRLPSLFIAFDMYDRVTGAWYTRAQLHDVLKDTGIPVVPVLTERAFNSRDELITLLETQSRYRHDGPLEGIYLRHEAADGSMRRCKLVRPDFVQGITSHWMTGEQKKNTLVWDPAKVRESYSYASSPAAAATADGDPTATPAAPPLPAAATGPVKTAVTVPRERRTVTLPSGDSIILPRNFSFVLEAELAVSSTPERPEQITALKTLGVGLVITLTEETPLPAGWFEGTGVRNLFVPIPNFEPQSMLQMDSIVDEIGKTVAAGDAVMEHCGGGEGRAGTVAACVLLRYGVAGIAAAAGSEGTAACHMSSEDAVRYVRHVWPGSIETAQQEDFVRAYASHLWSFMAGLAAPPPVDGAGGKSNPADTAAASSTATPIKDKTRPPTPKLPAKASAKTKRAAADAKKARKSALKRAPDIIVLVGIPGAGKSTIAGPLERAGWHRCSQDDFGRKETEKMAGIHSKIGKRCVLDRCNVEPAERRQWLELMHSPVPGRTAAIHLDIAVDECVRRVGTRQGHPTIVGGTAGSEKIVRSFAKRLKPPIKEEGFGQIFTVKSREGCLDLLAHFGVQACDDFALDTQPPVAEPVNDFDSPLVADTLQ